MNNILDLAKKAQNAEELISLAKEAGIDLKPEEAKQYFAKANLEICDENLEQVAGGVDALAVGTVFRF